MSLSTSDIFKLKQGRLSENDKQASKSKTSRWIPFFSWPTLRNRISLNFSIFGYFPKSWDLAPPPVWLSNEPETEKGGSQVCFFLTKEAINCKITTLPLIATKKVGGNNIFVCCPQICNPSLNYGKCWHSKHLPVPVSQNIKYRRWIISIQLNLSGREGQKNIMWWTQSICMYNVHCTFVFKMKLIAI